MDGLFSLFCLFVLIVFRGVTLTWLVENLSAVETHFGPSSFASVVASVLSGFSSGASHGADVSEISAFLEADAVAGNAMLEERVGERLRGCLEAARDNEEWVEANFADVYVWVEANPPAEPTFTTTTTETTHTAPDFTRPQPDTSTTSHSGRPDFTLPDLTTDGTTVDDDDSGASAAAAAHLLTLLAAALLLSASL